NGFTVNQERVTFFTGKQSSISAGKTRGQGAELVDSVNNFWVQFSGEHHAHHPHCFRGRHPVAAFELVVDAQTVKHFTDLRAAPVHNDGFEAGVVKIHNIFGERFEKFVRDHRIAPKFHHHDGATKTLQPFE